jgi:tRNA pseudouridine38-40 synthase
MTRWKLTLEYDGAAFHGWQRQDRDISVQQVVEEAIFKMTGETVTLTAAGRTDAGVHALGQVAHVDLEKEFPAETIRNAVNVHVRPYPVAVVSVEKTHPEFHARFDACGRYYKYIICNRPAPPVNGADYCWHVHRDMNLEAMQRAAKHLIGTHDFTSFRAVECQAKSPVRTLDKCEIVREGENIAFYFESRSFLHHQVRNIVGTLRKIGDGSWDSDCIPEILAAKNRIAAGPTAPPQGLFFVRVDYTETGSK